MNLFTKRLLVFVSLLVPAPSVAVTLQEVVSQVEKMSRAEREAFLIKGAREEKDVMFTPPRRSIRWRCSKSISARAILSSI